MNAGFLYSTMLLLVAPFATSANGNEPDLSSEPVVSDYIADLEQTRKGRRLPQGLLQGWAVMEDHVLGYYSARGELRDVDEIDIWFSAFRAECVVKGGQIVERSSASYGETVLSLFKVYVISERGDRLGNRRALEICSDASGRPMGGLIWAHNSPPGWTAIVALGPDVIIGEADAVAKKEAEEVERKHRLAESHARFEARKNWQQTVGEGELTGCGRILTAREQIVEIADRRTGQARWVERTDLNQPHEGCS